ncbi:hypothetical protein BC332_14705 [Capsicum chinense]|nr:hypothetical protein BC332_14705 [Capsicum chinense]
MKRHSCKHFCSLTITGDEMEDGLSDACHLRNLRLLRVLMLRGSFMMVKDALLNEICMLNHLRFLLIGTELKSLPSSFSNLWNLETLWVENKGSTLVLLPSIWDLEKLRGLKVRELGRINGTHSFLFGRNRGYFQKFPNLQKLRFVLKESWDYSTERFWFPKLDFLTELKILRAEFESSNTNDSAGPFATNWSCNFQFPSNLKILSLWNFPLTFDSLSTIARLPNLEVLGLMRTVIQEEEWNMGEEDTFVNLKYLELFQVTLAKWEFAEESFPVFEKLVLSTCLKLEEIPSIFGDIYSLKSIKLTESPQLEDSALGIKQYVEDMTGEDKLQILGPNNIPLSKTGGTFKSIKYWIGELNDEKSITICYSIRNEATFTRIHIMETITLEGLRHEV